MYITLKNSNYHINQALRKQCQDFATALLDHTRSSYELEVLLNYDPDGPAYRVTNIFHRYKKTFGGG